MKLIFLALESEKTKTNERKYNLRIVLKSHVRQLKSVSF